VGGGGKRTGGGTVGPTSGETGGKWHGGCGWRAGGSRASGGKCGIPQVMGGEHIRACAAWGGVIEVDRGGRGERRKKPVAHADTMNRRGGK